MEIDKNQKTIEVTGDTQAVSSLFGRLNELIDRDIVLAVMFSLVNVFLFFVISAAVLDHLFNFCTYNPSKFDFFTGSFVSCPPEFAWYEAAVPFLSIPGLYLLFLLSIGIFAVPELLIGLIYLLTLDGLGKKIKSYSANITQGVSSLELNVVRGLRLSLLLLPLIFITSVILIDSRMSKIRAEERAAVQEFIQKREAEYLSAAKNNPDFCRDAPDGVYLTTSNTADSLTLHYPLGYWNGSGVAHLSRENYWDGSEDLQLKFHIESYSPGIITFTERSQFSFSDTLNIAGADFRYDLRVYMLNDNARSLLRDNEEFTGRFTFFRGVFKERFVKDGLTFNVYDPTYLAEEECLTVVVNSTPVPPSKILIPETEATLGAPGAILVRNNEVSLMLPGRECDRMYAVERSYDMSLWEHVATTTFSTYPTQDPDFRSCENDVLDSGVASGTRQLFYRYGSIDESGRVTKWSAIGTVLIEAE